MVRHSLSTEPMEGMFCVVNEIFNMVSLVHITH
jgi:hypothetical protein